MPVSISIPTADINRQSPIFRPIPSPFLHLALGREKETLGRTGNQECNAMKKRQETVRALPSQRFRYVFHHLLPQRILSCNRFLLAVAWKRVDGRLLLCS